MNSFVTFEQPYFYCKTKLKIKFILYRTSMFYKQIKVFQSEFFLTEFNFMKGDTNIYFD